MAPKQRRYVDDKKIFTERRQKAKLFARLDHSWNADQFTTVRAADAITHRSFLSGGRASNVLSVQLGTYIWNFPPRSEGARPQVTIVGPGPSFVTQAVVGSTNFVFDERETQLQLRNVYERAIGTGHTLRIGGDAIAAKFRLFAAGTNPLGSYVVVNNGEIRTSTDRPPTYTDIPSTIKVLSYTVDARPQRVNVSQAVVGAFVEDVWKLSPSVTAIGGVRWEYDDVTSRGQSNPDLSAFQPRLSINWYRSPRSVVRGGIGVYAGKFPYATLSNAQQLGANGNATVTFAGSSAPPFGMGAATAALASASGTLPPREVFTDFPRGLKTPRSYQATLGLQSQIGESCGVSADVVGSRTINRPRLLDLNPIRRQLTAADTANRGCASATNCPGDASRPTAPPGDPIYNFTPGPPRQLQLSLGWLF